MLKSLQILRFVAAVSVVNWHLTWSFGSFGVDIFFVLSGFVIALVVSDYHSPTSFAINRISRIVPIYWLLTTLLLLLMFLTPKFVHESTIAGANISNYLRSIFFIPFYLGGDIKPLLRLGWTLNYEMLFYLLVWLSLIITRTSLALTSALILFLYLIFAFGFESNYATGFFGDDIILEFIIGIIAFKIYKYNYLQNIPSVVLILITILSYAFMAYIQSADLLKSRFLFYGIPSFFVVLSFVGLEKHIIKVKSSIVSFFVSMGDASYATYLTHWYVIVACRKIISEKYELYDFYSPIGIIITLIVSLIVGQTTYYYADKPLSLFVKRNLLNKFRKPDHIKK